MQAVEVKNLLEAKLPNTRVEVEGEGHGLRRAPHQVQHLFAGQTHVADTGDGLLEPQLSA